MLCGKSSACEKSMVKAHQEGCYFEKFINENGKNKK
jgi:hypothetical protein